MIDKEKNNKINTTVTPKMNAFLELEKMLVPIPQELDYDKELAQARNEKYNHTSL